MPAPTTATTQPAAPAAGGYAGGGAGARAVPTPPPPPHFDADEEVGGGEVAKEMGPHTNRLGLGTEFGEQRTSSATYTRFVRASNRPVAIAELRYNDASGLQALGIVVQPMPDQGELTTRETADPFPGDPHFAAPPTR